MSPSVLKMSCIFFIPVDSGAELVGGIEKFFGFEPDLTENWSGGQLR